MTVPPSFDPQENRPRPQRKRPGSSATNPEVPQRKSVYGEDSSLPPAFAPKKRPTAQPTQSQPLASPDTQPRNPLRQLKPESGAAKTRPLRQKRKWPVLLAIVIAILVAWPTFLMWNANNSMHRVDAGTTKTSPGGTTYLFAGSDSREGWEGEETVDTTERSDSAILIHKAKNGQASMVSIPRDSYVNIPGVGWSKFNAAFAVGGPKLMVATVEELTGVEVDHYVQVGMGGVGEIVDSLGGVELCWDSDVDDPKSGMEWTAGCHVADGEETLAFARMRYQDPRGDHGRAERQRQVLGSVTREALSPGILLNPLKQYDLSSNGAAALTVDENTNIRDVARMVFAMKKASATEMTGPAPIAEASAMNEAGSVVLLDDEALPDFFDRMDQGELSEEDFDSAP